MVFSFALRSLLASIALFNPPRNSAFPTSPTFTFLPSRVFSTAESNVCFADSSVTYLFSASCTALSAASFVAPLLPSRYSLMAAFTTAASFFPMFFSTTYCNSMDAAVLRAVVFLVSETYAERFSPIALAFSSDIPPLTRLCWSASMLAV